MDFPGFIGLSLLQIQHGPNEVYPRDLHVTCHPDPYNVGIDRLVKFAIMFLSCIFVFNQLYRAMQTKFPSTCREWNITLIHCYKRYSKI